MHRTEYCDVDRIERYLSDSLAEEQQRVIESPMTECDRCRNELERQAADSDTWHGAIRMLNHSDPLSLNALTGSTHNGLSSNGEALTGGTASECVGLTGTVRTHR